MYSQPSSWRVGKMARVKLYPQIIYHSISPFFPCISHSKSVCGNTVVAWGFWGSPHLTLYTIVYISDTLPFLLSAAARFTKSYYCHANNKCQAAEQNSFKILQCTSMHWPSFKTMRANPAVFSTTLTQMQTSLHSNNRVCNTENSSDIFQDTLRCPVEGKLCPQGCDPQLEPQIFHAQ